MHHRVIRACTQDLLTNYWALHTHSALQASVCTTSEHVLQSPLALLLHGLQYGLSRQSGHAIVILCQGLLELVKNLAKNVQPSHCCCCVGLYFTYPGDKRNAKKVGQLDNLLNTALLK